MPQTSDFILERFTQWGIHRIYGYPGDGINAMLGSFDRANGEPEFIQTRHEEMAAFMATAHAKFTGGLGCCIATSGGGAIHLLNGLYDAKLDHQPVVALIGQQKRMSLGAQFQQEIDPISLFKDVSEFVQYCMVPAQARQLVDRACKVALSNRTVATIILPEDVGESEAVPSPPRSHGAVYTSVGWSKPRVIPYPDDIQQAADLLNEGEKVAMLIGQGAAGAVDEVMEAADVLGAGVAKTSLGRSVLPDDLSYATGPIGLLGSNASQHMMTNADTLFMIGTSFPYTEWLPEEGQCRGVEIDLDGRMIGVRYPMDFHLVGDSKETLKELIPKLQRKQDRSWREELESEIRKWRRILDDRAHDSADPMNPQLVAHELSQRLPDEAIITIKRYYDRLSQGAPLVFCVFNNEDLKQVTWEQRVMAGDPKYPGSQYIPDVPYAEWAKMLGLTGIKCDSPDWLGDAWDQALSASGPVVLEVVTSNEVPPMPPHVKQMQIDKGLNALRQGDPQAVGMMVEGAKQKSHEFVEAARQRMPGNDDG